MQPATDYGRARMAECRAIVGGSADPFADQWRGLGDRERRAWLSVAGQSVAYARLSGWAMVPADVRAHVRAAMARAAKRAEVLTRGMQS